MAALETDLQGAVTDMNMRMRELQANASGAQAVRPADDAAPPHPTPQRSLAGAPPPSVAIAAPGSDQTPIEPGPSGSTMIPPPTSSPAVPINPQTPVNTQTTTMQTSGAHVTPVPPNAGLNPGPNSTGQAMTTLSDLTSKMKAAIATQQADVESLARTLDDVNGAAMQAIDAANKSLEERRLEIAAFAASINPGSNGGPE